MIQHLEILRYRCHRYTSVSLAPLHVLAGPAGSGKSTFLDAIRLLSDLVAHGLDDALAARTDTFSDLLWRGSSNRTIGEGGGRTIELAVECTLPEGLPDRTLERLAEAGYTLCRYELAIGAGEESEHPVVLAEKLLLMDRPRREHRDPQQPLFPLGETAPPTVLTPRGLRGTKTVVHKLPESNDKFYDERGEGWDLSFRLGPSRLALGGLPEDEERFPVSRWLRRFLTDAIRWESPDLEAIRRPLPPRRNQPDSCLLPNSTNLAAVVERLQRSLPDQTGDWIAQLKQIEPHLTGISVARRPLDQARCLTVHFKNDVNVPAWSLSEGLLRAICLTLPTVAPPPPGVRLIESPETAQHPLAMPAIATALASVHESQTIATVYAPELLRQIEPEHVLDFQKDETGIASVRPYQHTSP